MRVLVIGANGLLGSNVVVEGLNREVEVIGTFHSTDPGFECDLYQLDITDYRELRRIVTDLFPDVVINCAAKTDVDGCEEDPETAHAINGEAPGQIAALCTEVDARPVHVSTDYVFDGEAETPYDEAAKPNPIQTYGESKLAGERAVRASDPDSLVLRLSFVYGIHRATDTLRGFPAWVRDRIAAGEPTPLFTDQHVTPSRAGQVASVVYDLLDRDVEDTADRGAEGTVDRDVEETVDPGVDETYHVASRSCVTPHEFGRRIHDLLSDPPDVIERGSMADIDRAAVRPEHTCLDVGRLEAELGRNQPTLDEDLASIVGRIRGSYN